MVLLGVSRIALTTHASQEFDDLLNETDTSGDGEVDFQEFVAMLTS